MYHSFATRFVKVKCLLHLYSSDRFYRYVTFHNTDNKLKSMTSQNINKASEKEHKAT